MDQILLKDSKMNKRELAFFFTVIVLLFHITRNISMILYIAVLFISYLWLYIIFSVNINLAKIRSGPVSLLFIVTLIWVPVISLLNMNISDYILALPRYIVTFPFILFCYLFTQYRYEFVPRIIKAFCIFMTIAAVSIPFQMVFGNISFLTDSSMREGFERYSSLAGSLVSLGTLGAFSLAFLMFSDKMLFNNKVKVSLILVTIFCMLLTLQKAAILNVIIIIVAFVFTGKISLMKRVLAVLLMLAFVFGIYYFFKDSNFGRYIESIINYTFAKNSVGIVADLINRFWELPSKVITFNEINFFDLLIGIGFPSLSGTMGLAQYPMAHNNYFDLILSGGILHLLTFLYLITRIPFNVIVKRIKGRHLNVIDRSYSVVSFIILINMLIGAASIYQPINAVVIFIIIFSYDKLTASLKPNLDGESN